jgi:hypothetical protein
MSDDLPDESLPDDQSQKVPRDLTPEEQALADDLNLYANPEVFSDSTLPQIYKLYIRTLRLPETSFILDIEVNGEDLPAALREGMLGLMHLDPNFHGNINEVRAEMLADPEYAEADLAARRFFVRHLPKLMVHIYNILVATTVLSVTAPLWDEPTEKEKLFRFALKGMLRELEKDIKKMLQTRSSGRPKRVETFPEIVIRVLDVANEMIHLAEGRNVVPGLKQIADRLGFNVNALGKQLVRAGYPWKDIRTHLENRPIIEKQLMAEDKNPS